MTHPGDIVIINGEAVLTPDRHLRGLPGYLDKYEAAITGPLASTVEEFDGAYSTEVRIRPSRVRLTPS